MQNRKRDTDVQNRRLDSVGEGASGIFWENSIETSILSRVKQINSPGWMRETVLRAGAPGRPRGMGWRGRREWGLGWGAYVNPWLIHVNVWQKPQQYCKVISLQLIKINEEKKKYWSGLPFPSPGNFPNPGIKPASPAWQVDSSPLSHQGSQWKKNRWKQNE